MTTFTQKLANAGYVWKILRIKDLMLNGWVVMVPALGVEPVVFWLTEMGI
jgi:hypothetical protein